MISRHRNKGQGSTSMLAAMLFGFDRGNPMGSDLIEMIK
jgi:hypothetical protein